VLGLIVPDTRRRDADLIAYQDLLSHPERYVSNETEHAAGDGQRVWITWRNTPITDAEGRLIEIVLDRDRHDRP